MMRTAAKLIDQMKETEKPASLAGISEENYTVLSECIAAYGGDTFGWSAGSFTQVRSAFPDHASMGPILHDFRVPCHHKRRDGLLQNGHLERVPSSVRHPGYIYRVSAKILAAIPEDHDAEVLEAARAEMRKKLDRLLR